MGPNLTTNTMNRVQRSKKSFAENVKKECLVFEEAGNPFSDISTDLYTFDTKHIVPDLVKVSVETAESIGTKQFQAFCL